MVVNCSRRFAARQRMTALSTAFFTAAGASRLRSRMLPSSVSIEYASRKLHPSLPADRIAAVVGPLAFPQTEALRSPVLLYQLRKDCITCW